MQFIAKTYLFICLFDCKALFVCIKDRTCPRIAIPVYCFNIFGSIFGVLFCLLIKKLILGCKTVWQIMRQIISFYEQFEVWEHFLIWIKKKHFFLENCTAVWSEFFEKPFHKTWKFKNLKISENLATNFSERKGIGLCSVQMIYVHLLTFNYRPLQYAKRLSNI